MDFNEIYKQKLTTADEAVKVIRSGDWIDYGWCTGTVDALDKALAKRMPELSDINIRGGILLKSSNLKMQLLILHGTLGIAAASREKQ